ncbi:MAG TPA: P-loop NTPase [Novosphingobium sp.]|nr:P-loop NTPase [Novosphingobium sp.]
MTPARPGRFFIVAREPEIASLRSHKGLPGFNEATFVPLPLDAQLDEHVLALAQVLVLEVDPSVDPSLRRIARVRSERPDLPIIAALSEANVSLMRMLIRQGVTDVATLPFAPEELASQILDQFAKVAEPAFPADLAPMFSVVRSTGGCGATTVITHLAEALAQHHPGEHGVCVIDLDLQGGDVAAFVGETPNVSIAALLEAGDRLDNDLLRSAITSTRFGFSVVAAPSAVTPLETVDLDQLLTILRLVRSRYRYVLVDLPAAWTNWALSVALASSQVLLLTDFSISSLRQAKRRLELFASVGMDAERIKVVANRAERRLFRTIGTDEIGEALNCPVAGTLSLEGANLRSAQDQGLLISSLTNKSKFVSDVGSLADGLR